MKFIRAARLFFLASLIAAQTFTPRVHAAGNEAVPKNLKFVEVVSGLTNPLFVAHAGDASGRLFIVQRDGKILIFKNGALNPTPFLDIGGSITTGGNEQGLLGLAFDPNYETNGRFFVVYTDNTFAPNKSVVLARYQVSNSNPDLANPNSGVVLLSIEKSHTNHNGGTIAFGPDGYLYMSVGDGGGGGDPGNNGQNQNSLLGKILRLDVSGSGYTIPASNPFAGQPNVKEEIWAYGLRNPWRFSFDRLTGDIFIGDVGQNRQEEIDFQPAASAGGENYGWRILEGNLCYDPSSNCAPPTDYVPPVAVYNHGDNDSFGCSVTGGYVYRGSQFPALEGVYLYGDFCKGKIWGLVKNANDQWVSTLIADTGYLISSFGENEDGELYVVDYAGRVLKIVEAQIVQKTFVSQAAYDGYIRESSETSGQGGLLRASASQLRAGDDSANRQFRSVLSFDTSQIPDNAVIISAVLKFKHAGEAGTSPFATHGLLLADIRKGSFNGNNDLELTDFAAAASRNGALQYSSATVSGWYSQTLGAARLNYINKLGLTQFRLRFQTDDDNDLGADFLKIYSGNADSANRPQLIVEYYVP